MSKKFIVLNALIALSLLACQPIRKKDPLVDGSKKQETTKTDLNSNPGTDAQPSTDGTIVKRAAEPLKLIELSRDDNKPFHIQLEIAAATKEDEKTKAKVNVYSIHVSQYGEQSEAQDETLTLKSDSPLYAPLDSVFQGKQALVEKPIPAGLVGAGVTKIRVTTAKESNVRFIVNEPSIEGGSETFFTDLLASVRKAMDAKIAQKKKDEEKKPEEKKPEEKKPAEKKPEEKQAGDAIVTNTLENKAGCAGLDLAGVWKTDRSMGTLVRTVTSTLVPLKTTDGSVQYTGTDETHEQGCFGPGSDTKETVTYAYDGATCRILQNKLGEDKKPKLGAFLVIATTHAKQADGSKGALTSLTVQACKDESCKEPADSKAEPMELIRQAAAQK